MLEDKSNKDLICRLGHLMSGYRPSNRKSMHLSKNFKRGCLNASLSTTLNHLSLSEASSSDEE
jgi:hypothetical protein